MKRLILLALLSLAACESPPQSDGRYLTAEEDANLRASCEPAGGCAMIPLPDFQKLMTLLKACVKASQGQGV